MVGDGRGGIDPTLSATGTMTREGHPTNCSSTVMLPAYHSSIQVATLQLSMPAVRSGAPASTGVSTVSMQGTVVPVAGAPITVMLAPTVSTPVVLSSRVSKPNTAPPVLTLLMPAANAALAVGTTTVTVCTPPDAGPRLLDTHSRRAG